MNKSEVIRKIEEKLNCDREKAEKINEIVEDTFFLGRKNKEKIIQRFIMDLSLSEEEASHIYNEVMSIFGEGIKDKIKHPFRDLDQ